MLLLHAKHRAYQIVLLMATTTLLIVASSVSAPKQFGVAAPLQATCFQDVFASACPTSAIFQGFVKGSCCILPLFHL